ncbi:MAG: hypothetical protein ACKN9D_16830, partial [Actinomycetales bacterium]
MTPTGLAEASNLFIYVSMLALLIATIAFAGCFAAGRRRAPVQQPALQGGGGVAVLTRPEDSAPARIEPGRRAGNVGMSTTWLAFGLLLVGVVLRGLWASR